MISRFASFSPNLCLHCIGFYPLHSLVYITQPLDLAPDVLSDLLELVIEISWFLMLPRTLCVDLY